MASSFKKPDGLTLIDPKDVTAFLSPLPVKKLWGIGKVTEEKLLQMGIET
jgi:DNA polymerase IV (DinB-like DNA polymerase)